MHTGDASEICDASLNDGMACIKGVLTEMLADRGFYDIEHLGGKACNDCPILAGRDGEDRVCYVYVTEMTKIGINYLRTTLAKHQSDPSYCSLILVSVDGATSFTERKMQHDDAYNMVSVFKTREVVRNVTRHHLVPRHTLCSQCEVNAIVKKHNLQTLHHLPYLYKGDPVVRYYNFQVGSVVKIERLTGVQEMQHYYRLVIDAD